MAASPLSSLSSSKTLILSVLCSPKPLSKRKNHLRPKFPPKLRFPPKQEVQFPPELIHESQSLNTFPNPNTNPLPKQIEDGEVVKSVVELTQESQTLDPFPNPNPNPDSNKSFILDISLRFAALLFVQTVVAVLILGHGNGGVKIEGGVRVFEKKADSDKREEMLDFQRAVLEIREMANEARAREVKEREENEFESEGMLLKGVSDKKASSKKDLVKGRLSSRKRLGFVRSNVRRKRNVGEGFGVSKKAAEGNGTDGNGGIQQIGNQNSNGDSTNLHEPRQSTVYLTELVEKSTHADSLVLPYDESSYVGELHESQITIERSESDHETSVVNHNSSQRETQIKQRLKEGQQSDSTKSSSINGRSEPQSKKNEAVIKSVANKLKASPCDPREKPWWMELPFVLAILMRRGSDRNSPKGLYSLKMDSTSDDGSSASYTIVFQHQGDATNFCYLLESFFEELDDFSADIVPLTIDELEEGEKSGALNVVVVRKGQLQLYAGQPLADAETALRSLLD